MVSCGSIAAAGAAVASAMRGSCVCVCGVTTRSVPLAVSAVNGIVLAASAAGTSSASGAVACIAARAGSATSIGATVLSAAASIAAGSGGATSASSCGAGAVPSWRGSVT